MNFEEIEQQFRELKEQWEAGDIDDEHFEAEVKKFQFWDEQGRLWRIGASGTCYREEGGKWLEDRPSGELEQVTETVSAGTEKEPSPKPPGKPVLPATPPPVEPPVTPPSKRVLLLAEVVLVIIVLIAGILVGPVLIPRTATPTVVVLVTKTATLSPTLTPTQMPTDTSSPTATLTQEPTVEPTEEPTSEPIEEPTEEPTVEPTEEPTSEPTEEPTEEPTVEPTEELIGGGKIAFPVFDPQRGTYDIFIANADGTDREKIKEEASQPCLSPDGSEITYRSWRNDKRGLIVAHTLGDDIWTITTRHEASRPSVSRGGTAYHCKEPDRPVHIYLTHGSGEPEVIRWGDQHQPISGESPAWVSGERLVYKGCVGGTCGLYLTDGVYDGTGITQLTHDTSDTNPEASPDGKKVAFMSQRDGNWEIYVMDLDNGTIKRLTHNGANDGLPIWSPDGQTIAFASDRGGEWAVWAMNSDGSNQRMLFPLGGSLHGYVRDAPLHERGGWGEERLSWSP